MKGYKLAVQAEDDQKNPQLGAQAATKLASTPGVVGVVSTLNSSVSQSVQPILDQAGILQISPANTNDTLTKGKDFATAPKRPFKTYFRTCTVDSLQGPYAADYLVEKAGKKNIAIITDGLTYGEGLADTFTKQAEKKGAKIVTRQKIGEKDTDFSGVDRRGQAVQAGRRLLRWPVPAGRPAVQAARRCRSERPGDGWRRHLRRQLHQAGRQGRRPRDLRRRADRGPGQREGVRRRVRQGAATRRASAPTVPSPTTPRTRSSARSPRPSATRSGRTRCARTWSTNAQEYSADGATGKVAFDEFGDSTNKVLTVYQVSGGKWDAVQTGEFGG